MAFLRKPPSAMLAVVILKSQSLSRVTVRAAVKFMDCRALFNGVTIILGDAREFRFPFGCGHIDSLQFVTSLACLSAKKVDLHLQHSNRRSVGHVVFVTIPFDQGIQVIGQMVGLLFLSHDEDSYLCLRFPPPSISHSIVIGIKQGKRWIDA